MGETFSLDDAPAVDAGAVAAVMDEAVSPEPDNVLSPTMDTRNSMLKADRVQIGEKVGSGSFADVHAGSYKFKVRSTIEFCHQRLHIVSIESGVLPSPRDRIGGGLESGTEI